MPPRTAGRSARDRPARRGGLEIIAAQSPAGATDPAARRRGSSDGRRPTPLARRVPPLNLARHIPRDAELATLRDQLLRGSELAIGLSPPDEYSPISVG